MPPIESPSAASIPFINLFASMASSVENNGVAEPTYKALFLEIIYAQKFQTRVPNEKHAIFFKKNENSTKGGDSRQQASGFILRRCNYYLSRFFTLCGYKKRYHASLL